MVPVRCGELGGGQRPAGGELAVEAEAVADDDERGVDGGAELDDGLAEQRVEALLVERGALVVADMGRP